MTPVSNDALAAGIAAIGDDIRELRETVLRQNGRIGVIEIARAEEKGERTAVALAAAETAAALHKANAIKEKSRAWKVKIITAAVGGLGGIVTVGALVAHALIQIVN